MSRFSVSEDRMIDSLRVKGWSLRKIAAAVGRPHSSVQLRLQKLAEIAECDLLDSRDVLVSILAADTLAVAKRLARTALGDAT